ncbi:hypothetical protein ACH5RR_001828 [Cinchona calisaya]|uniref:Uncharacterized protein n=1 Tax=Cinchona calisaya TaxID=153742 RepID=A0ABD3B4I2_9GENT
MAEIKTADSPLLSSEEPPPPPRETTTNFDGDGDGDGDDYMPDAQNPKKSPHDEAQLNLQIQTLETELSSNPSHYDAHVQYIRALRKQRNLEKLRQARQAMTALFPLGPELWWEWTRDESALSSGITLQT